MAAAHPGIKILILRRTYPQLRENHILPMLRDFSGAAVWKESEKCFLFPGGSRIKFGYCDNEGDLLQYQGAEFDVIFIDEATQLPEAWFLALTACLRGTGNFPRRLYLTCNPGGVGHDWVKRLFIDRDFRPGENPADYLFIPARVTDNTALLAKDPGYLETLQRLPEGLRRAWLDGDWNVLAGRFFSDWDERRGTFEPFPIPARWRRYLSIDYGLDMLAVCWIAVDGRGRCWVYREFCEGMDLGEGHRGLIVSEAIDAIRAATPPGERIHACIAPPDLWNRKTDTGRSTAEQFAAAGMPLTRAENDRVMGWLQLREYLACPAEETAAGGAGTPDAAEKTEGGADAESGGKAPEGTESSRNAEGLRGSENLRGADAESGGKGTQSSRKLPGSAVASGPNPEAQADGPMLRISRGCPELIRCLTSLCHDPARPGDCLNTPHAITHLPDALRYFIAGRPAPAREPARTPVYNFRCERPAPRPGGFGEKVRVR